MDKLERRSRIRANLGIELISHGQVYTFQIAIPELEHKNISLERQQLIEDSLTQHKSNLVPLIVRRTQAYSEEEEYEVIHGVDWCIIAKELEIEKLWVWVFDMTDEQAAAAREEMQQLLNHSKNDEINVNTEINIDNLLEQKLKPIYSKLNQIFSSSSNKVEKSNFDEKLRNIEIKIENVESEFKKIIELIQEFIKPKKLDLVTAGEEEIKNALEEAGANNKQKNAAWEAIQYWKAPNRSLTWTNLKKSVESGSEHKIKNFAIATYQKLKKIADIYNN